MLVLSRRANERIVFPSLDIAVHILKLTGSGARVGIEAPAEVTVLCDERSTHPRELNIPAGPTGFDAWFAKPLNPRRLWDAMQASLGSSAPAHAN